MNLTWRQQILDELMERILLNQELFAVPKMGEKKMTDKYREILIQTIERICRTAYEVRFSKFVDPLPNSTMTFRGSPIAILSDEELNKAVDQICNDIKSIGRQVDDAVFFGEIQGRQKEQKRPVHLFDVIASWFGGRRK